MIIILDRLQQQTPELPLQVNLLGFDHQQEAIDRPHGLSLYQWFYCERGSGALTVDGRRMIIHERQGFLLHPNVNHIYKPQTDDWTVHFVGFQGSICGDLLVRLNMHESGAYYFSDPGFFRDSVTSMVSMYQSNRRNAIDIAAACFRLLLGLAGRISQIENIGAYDANPIVDRAIAFIERNYMRRIGLADIAAEAGVSKEYLCDLFKRTMGQTVHRFLTMTRIAHARIRLLQFPGDTVAEVALDCGFRSPSRFCTVFRQYNGVTPDMFRKTHS